MIWRYYLNPVAWLCALGMALTSPFASLYNTCHKRLTNLARKAVRAKAAGHE